MNQYKVTVKATVQGKLKQRTFKCESDLNEEALKTQIENEYDMLKNVSVKVTECQP